ncbi:MAG: DUF4097 family beta strand repeat-containing protein, partial [Corallococcus sp.]|nr:DUF4097 family beta strand repeat-containing protein [Corallococcus sp.]
NIGSGAVKEINVTADTYSVFVEQGEFEYSSVSFIVDDCAVLDADAANDGVISFTQTESANFFTKWFETWLQGSKKFVVIKLNGSVDKVTVKCKVGEVVVKNLSCGQISIDGEVNTVQTENITAQTVDINTNVGYVNIKTANVSEFSANATTAAVNLNDVSATNFVKTVTTTGAISAQNISAPSIAMSTTTGAVNTDGLTAQSVTLAATTGTIQADSIRSDKISLKVTTGAIDCKVIGSKADYTVRVNKGSGSCNVENQQGTSADCLLEVSGSTGSIDIDFVSHEHK